MEMEELEKKIEATKKKIEKTKEAKKKSIEKYDNKIKELAEELWPLCKEYSEKYMPYDEYNEFYRKRSFEELISDGVYTEYKGLGLNDLMKDDPEKPIKDWTNEAFIRKRTVKYD